MRIAVSGAHGTGKTTLIGVLLEILPSFRAVDEPYHLLAEEGHTFAEAPSVEDFESQLARSIDAIAESDGNCIFDRCPSDLLAYLTVHDDAAAFDADRWIDRCRRAMRQLDLVVFVPVEVPDRVAVPDSEAGPSRQLVDDALRDIVMQDSWGFGVPAIQVTGTPGERARQVATLLERSDPFRE